MVKFVPCSSRSDNDLLAVSTSDLGLSRFCRHHCRGLSDSTELSPGFNAAYNLEVQRRRHAGSLWTRL